jgi:Major Facilitator Superfamily
MPDLVVRLGTPASQLVFGRAHFLPGHCASRCRFDVVSRCELHLGRPLEPKLLQPEIELRAREAETLGGQRPVPAALAQDLGDGLALDRAEVRGDHARRLARRVQCEVLRTDEFAFAKNGRALERIAELADVPRPVVPEQRLPGVPREARRRTRERVPDVLQPRLAERGNVGGALTEGRHSDVEDLQPVEEVLAEVGAFDGLPQVAVGCGLKDAARAFGTVFRNPRSILCGTIAGLLFMPTTIFDMIWGVRYLQEAHGFDYASAVLRSSTVPLGWIIGCPLLGLVSDRIGRRKPVIVGDAVILLACLGWILYGRTGGLPSDVVGLIAGIRSGAAMLPCTVIKEANPPQMSGTATGVVNFLNFTFSALLGPVFGWILLSVSGGATTMTLEHYQTAFEPCLYGVGLPIVLTLLLKETGPAVLRGSR